MYKDILQKCGDCISLSAAVRQVSHVLLPATIVLFFDCDGLTTSSFGC